MNSLLFFRSCLCRHILQNPRKKTTHFKNPQTTNSSINLTFLLQTILNCNVFALVITFFFISYWDKDLFSDFPGAKVYIELQHIRILPPPKSTAFQSCLLTHSFHTKTEWQPPFYQKYIMTDQTAGEPNSKIDSFLQKSLRWI